MLGYTFNEELESIIIGKCTFDFGASREFIKNPETSTTMLGIETYTLSTCTVADFEGDYCIINEGAEWSCCAVDDLKDYDLPDIWLTCSKEELMGVLGRALEEIDTLRIKL